MLGKKLISVINRMSGVEKRAFSKYLASPYHNQRKELIQLWNEILKGYGEQSTGMNLEESIRQIFPPNVFDKKGLRHLSSWMLKSIEAFFVLRKSAENKFEQELSLAQTYRKKRIDNLFKRQLEKAAAINAHRKLDTERYFAEYRLQFEQYAFIESQNRTDSTNLQGLSDSLDLYLVVSKLKQSCLMLSHQAVYKVQYDFSFLENLLEFLKGHPLLEQPSVGLYYHCYRAFSQNDSTHFYAFKNLLTQYKEEFSPQEIRSLLLFAINFCIRQMNEGDTNYTKEAWDLYLLGLDQKLLYIDKFLGRFTYKNIVALGIKLKSYHWTEGFINDYRDDLKPKYQQNYYNYNLAQLAFAQGDYQSAMPMLAQVDDSDLLLNFDAKVILIKMYFELEEIDALHSLLDSFRVMLQRKKVVGYHKSYYQDLILLTRKLLDIPSGKSQHRDSLKTMIEEKQKFPEKTWFLEMLASGR